MNMVSENDCFVITKWMLDMGLSSEELLAYAIVYPSCQNGMGRFFGDTSRIADFLGVSRERANEIFQRLISKGFFVRNIPMRDGDECSYTIPG